MTIKELISHLENFEARTGEEAPVVFDVVIDNKFTTRSNISNLRIYADTDSEGKWVKPIISLEAKLNVLGSVDTDALVNSRIQEMINTLESDDHQDLK